MNWSSLKLKAKLNSLYELENLENKIKCPDCKGKGYIPLCKSKSFCNNCKGTGKVTISNRGIKYK